MIIMMIMMLLIFMMNMSDIETADQEEDEIT